MILDNEVVRKAIMSLDMTDRAMGTLIIQGAVIVQE